MKKFILFFMFICLAVTGLHSQVATTTYFADTKLKGQLFREVLEGEGTEEHPYLIYTIAQLVQVSSDNDFLDKHYLQISDIDASVTSEWSDNNGFYPIGFDSNHSFTGSYNGQGHIISNLYINNSINGYVGLFGSVLNAVISNVGLVDMEISGRQRTGGLIGQAQSTTISNCYSRGIVTGTNIHIGGLVGVADSSFISNCYSTAVVAGDFNVGGLIGYDYSSIISDSYATGTVSVTSTYVGGLIGQAQSTTISNCYSTGHVSGIYDVGGLIGSLSGSSINNSFWDINTSGQNISAGGTGKTTQEMKNIQTYLDAGWDFETIWFMNANVNSGYPAFRPMFTFAGSGSATDPYQIANINDLLTLSENEVLWDKYFIQTANIDASLISQLNEGAGFNPIGNMNTYFIGSYDGQDYVISNLSIIRPNTNYIGLFGRTQNATISNVGLEDSHITGGVHVGSLVGSLYSSIINNSYSTGTISGDGKVGGLVGYSSSSTIDNSFTHGSVNGGTHWEGSFGGLVGSSSNFSTINNSYATGPISGNGSVGGLVGLLSHFSTVNNSYATGSSTGGSFVGGLVGQTSSATTINNSYAVGSVTGIDNLGGLVGYQYAGLTNNSFWDINTSGQNISAGGTGKTTQEMKNIQTYLDAGWDFIGETANGTEDIWSIHSEVNSGYPCFETVQPATPANPQGVQILMSGDTALISWEAVIEDIEQNAITINFYIIYYNDQSGNSNDAYTLLATTPELSYIHSGIGSSNKFMFYRVKACVGVDNRILDHIDKLIAQKRKITEEEIKSLLGRK